jgi:hypothetical protein
MKEALLQRFESDTIAVPDIQDGRRGKRCARDGVENSLYAGAGDSQIQIA